jgi:hypothetical protein
MKNEITYLGLVRRVVGAKVFIEITKELYSASPIVHGKIYRLGQIGSFVRIPLGSLNLYGVVSMVGASEAMIDLNTNLVQSPSVVGQRWIEIQLIGEAYPKEGFQRGVSIFPTIDDEVHLITEEDLIVIYGEKSEDMIEIGRLAASESLPATISLDKLITRHGAILGSTGSGKSNTVAGLLKVLATNAFPNASIFVIDPHGEYKSAFEGKAKVFSINDKTNPLVIPYWALSFDELAWFLVDRKSAAESQQDKLLRDRVFEDKTCVLN